ncbi:fimbrial protein [Aeromonas jandaei]|uniref:fimbrial protein n=1 Tax=Aeromonas jandaei TaxID=650 RepID=UPI001ABF5F00|nr:fimbrial protein [Aeromonas jandaei]QSR71952.1 type 1 fimbrial protein [Aeromonas jandaei]
MSGNKALFVVMFSIMSGYAMADDATPAPTPTSIPEQTRGTINFTGAIIDAPCSIASESVNQTVQMGQISSRVLELNKEGPLRPFEIHLEGCTLDTVNSATVTFNGIADNTEKTRLAVSGYAKGAAISLVSQHDGQEVVLGQPTNALTLVDGDNRLKFGAKVVSTLQTGAKAVAGEFSATTDFVMNYQ